jgi:hypothetical protein
MNKSKSYFTANLLKEFKVFTIKQLFFRKVLYFSYKFNLIKHKKRHHNTRIKNNLDITIIRILKSSQCFSHIGLNLLNKVLIHIINCISYTKHKNLIKTG